MARSGCGFGLLGCGGVLAALGVIALGIAASIPEYEPNKDPGFGGLVMIPLMIVKYGAPYLGWPLVGVGVTLGLVGLIGLVRGPRNPTRP